MTPMKRQSSTRTRNGPALRRESSIESPVRKKKKSGVYEGEEKGRGECKQMRQGNQEKVFEGNRTSTWSGLVADAMLLAAAHHPSTKIPTTLAHCTPPLATTTTTTGLAARVCPQVPAQWRGGEQWRL